MHTMEAARGVLERGAGQLVVDNHLDDVLDVLRISLNSIQIGVSSEGLVQADSRSSFFSIFSPISPIFSCLL